MGEIEEQQNTAETGIAGGLLNLTYEEKLKYCSVIAQPMATKKLCKKLFKLIRISWEKRTMVNGVKGVQKAIRKGEKGIVIFAGDVTPIDVISHLPIFCEDNGISYCYVPLRQEISNAMGVHRPCLAVLIKEDKEYSELYNECLSKIEKLEIQL